MIYILLYVQARKKARQMRFNMNLPGSTDEVLKEAEDKYFICTYKLKYIFTYTYIHTYIICIYLLMYI